MHSIIKLKQTMLLVTHTFIEAFFPMGKHNMFYGAPVEASAAHDFILCI